MTRAVLLGALALATSGTATAAVLRAPAAEALPHVDAHRWAEAPPYQDVNAPYDGRYHFLRVRWGGGGERFGFGRRGREALWAHDYPRGERNFLKILDETTFVRAQTEGSNIVTLDDPELFKYPVAYIVEVGFWDPSDEEVERLGEYLRKGGFLVVDDFRDERGVRALDNLALHLKRALPESVMMQVEDSDPIWDSFFRVEPDAVIPPYGPQNFAWYGIYEDNDRSKRLMAMINHNNDLSEYWEFSDYGWLPIDLSNEAYKLGVNYVVYALTH